MTGFSGLIPPLVTPLTEDGSIDDASLAAVIEDQLAAGASGLFVLGSSGEAIYLSDAARREVVETAVSVTAGRVPVLAGALEATAVRVRHQVEWLEPLGVDALVVTAPFYANPSAGEVRDHFASIAAAATVPVLAYDIPGNVGRRIPWTVLAELLADGTIAGLKDSSGSLVEFRRIIDRLGPGRRGAMLTGSDVLADLALDLGAEGLIPGIANARPDLFAGLISAHRAGDHARVTALQRAITALTEVFAAGERQGMGRHASELGALKHLLHRRGIISSARVSEPLEPYPLPALELVDRIHDAMQHKLDADLAAIENEERNP